MHIGQKIAEVLKQRHKTRQEIGRAMGMSGSAATYLTTRASIDVETLHKIGKFLNYNFFKHYPVDESGTSSPSQPQDQDDEKNRLTVRIAELEKQLEACKRDLSMQKQENVYLKKINELLEKKSH